MGRRKKAVVDLVTLACRAAVLLGMPDKSTPAWRKLAKRLSGQIIRATDPGPVGVQPTNGKCRCGNDSYDVPYAEKAWAKYAIIDGKLVFGEDGYNVEDSEHDTARAICHKCGTLTDLSDMEVA